MSKNRVVNTKFWSDGFVVDHCNALDRYLFLYLLTNEKTNILGIYELSLRTAAFETGIEKADLERMIERLSPKVEYFDGWVYIRRFTTHQIINPSVRQGMMREFFNLPMAVINRVRELGIDAPIIQEAVDSLRQAGDSLGTDSDSQAHLTYTLPIGISEVAPIEEKPKKVDKVELVFNHYLEAFNSRIKLSPKRRKQINCRLNDASYEMLIQAIDNCLTIPFYMGENDRGWTADLDYIIRSYENVEKLANSNKKRGEVKIEEW